MLALKLSIFSCVRKELLLKTEILDWYVKLFTVKINVVKSKYDFLSNYCDSGSGVFDQPEYSHVLILFRKSKASQV